MKWVDTSAPQTRITIGGLDLSLQFASADFSDDYLAENGLVATTGNLVLHRGAIPIDDWAGLSWLRIGSPVILEVFQGSAWVRHVRGALIVLGARYQPTTGRNSLEVACPIGARLAQAAIVDDLQITARTFQGVVNQLFTLSGLGSPVWGSITDDYQIYTGIKSRDSYLKTAGKMLADAGLFAWCNWAGVPIIDRAQASGLLFTADQAEMAKINRVLVGSTPATSAIVTGHWRSSVARANVRSTYTPTLGDVGAIVPSAAGSGIIADQSTQETIDPVNRTISFRNTDRVIGYNVFKGATGLPRTGLVQLSDEIGTRFYSQGSDYNLLQSQSVTTAPRYAALQAFCDWAIAQRIAISLSIDEQTRQWLEVRSYDDKDRLREIYTQVAEPIGAILSQLGSVDWRKVYDAFGVPGDLIVSERTYERWNEKAPGEWEKITTTTVSQVKDSRSQLGLQERIKNAQPSELIGIYRDAAACTATTVTREDDTGGRASPPDNERFPAAWGVSDLSYELEVPFAGFAPSWSQPKAYSCDYTPDRLPGEGAPIDFIQRYAQTWHGIAIQRWQALQVEMPYNANLANYRPYGRFKVTGGEADYVVAMNGTTWALKPQSAIVYSDCALIGRAIGDSILPIYGISPVLEIAIGLRLEISSTGFVPQSSTADLQFGIQLEVL